MTTPTGRKIYLVTGATGGIGSEATRQLLSRDTSCKVYLLGRSQAKAQALREELDQQKWFRTCFVRFDAFDEDSISQIDPIIEEPRIDGILLNAGGIGSMKKSWVVEKKADGGAAVAATAATTRQAQMNLIGHAALVEHLMSTGKIGKNTRIVASGSEACLGVPFNMYNWRRAVFKDHLTGNLTTRYLTGNLATRYDAGIEYGWIKGILAFYWSAFARKHPGVYVVTVSPGAVRGTGLMEQSSWILRMAQAVTTSLYGHHTIQDGARRYVDAMLLLSNDNFPSGSFVASRKGYVKDYGIVTDRERWSVFDDASLQDQAYEAVRSFFH